MPPPNRQKKHKKPGVFSGLFSSSKPVDVVRPSKSAAPATTSDTSTKAGAPKAPAPVISLTATAGRAADAMAPAFALATATPRAMPIVRNDDAVAAFEARPRIPSRLLATHVNFMVLGESGLGKTTFINNLVSSFKVVSAHKVQDGSATSLHQFTADPASLRTVLEPLDIPESSRRLLVTIQDMPGWGDDVNLARYLRTVTAFVLRGREQDYALLSGARHPDAAAMCGQLQHSITACLYFLPPHRVKKVDLILMAAISQLVTIIPVIAKADTMTEGELAAYRHEVNAMLAAPSKVVGARHLPALDVSLFGFGEGALAALGGDKGRLPLAVVCSRDSEALGAQAGARQQPVRAYRWGSCYPLNAAHSDLVLLKRLLLGDQVDSMYAMLDDSYSRYVAFCAAFEDSGKQLQMVVQDACQVGGPHLDDDVTKAKAALDSAKAAMQTLSEENRALTERLAVLEKEKRTLMERVRHPM